MKKKISKDPAKSKVDLYSLEYKYPESPIDLPLKYAVSNVTDPRTYSSNPKQAQNKSIESEYLEMSNFFYNNVDPRRKQELCDSRMVQEDHNAIANLSNEPVYHTFNQDEYPERLAMYNQSSKAKR